MHLRRKRCFCLLELSFQHNVKHLEVIIKREAFVLTSACLNFLPKKSLPSISFLSVDFLSTPQHYVPGIPQNPSIFFQYNIRSLKARWTVLQQMLGDPQIGMATKCIQLVSAILKGSVIPVAKFSQTYYSLIKKFINTVLSS